LVHVGRGLDRRRDVDVRQVVGAAAARPDTIDDLGFAGPQTHRRAGPRDVDRERRAPASSTDDRDAHAERRWPSFGSWPPRSRVMFAWCRATTIALIASAGSA